MDKQTEITAPLELLDVEGNLVQAGWARTPHWRFEPGNVRHNRHYLRQWDFFTVMSPDAAINFTLADIGFTHLCIVDVTDFAAASNQANLCLPTGRGELLLSDHPGGNAAVYVNGQHRVSYDLAGPTATLRATMPNRLILPSIDAEFELDWPTTQQSLNCVFPFSEQTGGFFYQNKIPALAAHGAVRVGNRDLHFAQDSSFAVMDWGRGVWPAQVFWRWGALATRVDGRVVGVNFGHGFGDQRAAGENLLTIDGVAHKLGAVEWELDRDNYLRPWRLVAPDDRVSLRFTPIYNQATTLEALIRRFKARRLFGFFSGELVLDDGSTLDVDHAIGFAEEVWIRW